ncbi:MAG: FAD-dependent oxidoreductase [Micropruina glycogenica]|jgi:NADPH-dependent 2,4-dienoyl-CoA reductase/sulfur reductase-like enzyme/rhodanese-related sulfurtransferase|uniref:Pyridine nucleotide-disulphide oxidoreductase family protein n=1 Tax=Micropruina glycogenica TaxID=75385 RepID=A0A2N9JBF7_9ACTN|nr:FAD-dependent oxidoreductase [Micropruina glycogenica]SPD85481.1 Pyridine nucleotide-disulphide oxidoreductase family protein [Micropruina glycogenica]
MKTVIIGGVAGGMSAATRLRRLDENAQIVVLERSGHVSFANCGLPYYIGDVITDRDALLLQTPSSLKARFGIDVRVNSEALSIDRGAKSVAVRNVATGEQYSLNYDSLILAPGAAPFVPPIPGVERALTLRNIADTDEMAAAVDAALARPEPTAVIMGGGFIGVELAENLTERGLKVTIVELADQLLAPLDVEMAALVEKHLVKQGVGVITGASVTEVCADSVALSTGVVLPADLVVAAIGVRPETGLAEAAGLELGERGGILVDDHQRTSDPSIFAVGDAVVKRDVISGAEALVPLAGPANRHGRLVADVIAGRTVAAKPVLGTAIVGAFGLAAAATGWTEKRARAAGRKVRVIHTHPANHAGYYPGAEGMSLKLVIDAETDAILGAQGVGGTGVDKRIDVIATAMRGGLTASDLADLELAYAPQFGSAKDPVNMLGFIAENMRDGLSETVQWHEVENEVGEGVQLIDVRTPAEYARGTVDGAVNIPVDDLRERIGEVAQDVIVHCQVGLRGYLAARTLAQHGRRVRNLDGGYRTWARI